MRQWIGTDRRQASERTDSQAMIKKHTVVTLTASRFTDKCFSEKTKMKASCDNSCLNRFALRWKMFSFMVLLLQQKSRIVMKNEVFAMTCFYAATVAFKIK